MKTETRYVCGVCSRSYSSKTATRRCEARGSLRPTVKVGDVVFGSAGFGWFDGNKEWVENPEVKKTPGHGHCFGACCTMRFYYVVTKIDRDPRDGHRPRYHLLTKAMSGKQGYRRGYTFDEGHIRPEPVANPPSIVLGDLGDVLGTEAKYLL